jgi:hypothetical protein
MIDKAKTLESFLRSLSAFSPGDKELKFAIVLSNGKILDCPAIINESTREAGLYLVKERDNQKG